MTATLALAMIVRDEEAQIARVLDEAAPVCDEMVVVDTGSTDATASIAAEHGATVHDVGWRDDFAAARNASFAWCESDWILWLDADDVLPEPSRLGLAALKDWLPGQQGIDVILGPYHLEISADGTVPLVAVRERLIRRGAGLRWEGKVRESIPLPEGRSAVVPELVVEHRPHAERRVAAAQRNLRMLEEDVVHGHPTPQTRFNYAMELFGLGRLADAEEAFDGYVDSTRLGGPDRYWAHLCLAECCLAVGHADDAREAAIGAVADDPSRAEAFVSLARQFYDAEQWAQAVPLLVAATAATQPTAGLMRTADYGYRPWDLLSVCLDRLGRRQEALTAAQRALPGNPTPDRVRERMRGMIDQL